MARVRSAFLALILLGCIKISFFTVFLVGSEYFTTFIYKIVLSASLLFPILVFLFSRNNPGLLLAYYGVQSAYLFVNLCYFLYFRNYLHLAQATSLLGELVSLTRSYITPFYPSKTWILLLDIPLVVYFSFGFKSKKALLFDGRLPNKPLIWFCFLLIIGLETFNWIGGKSVFQFNQHSGESSIVRRYGTLMNSALDIIKFPTEAHIISKIDHGPVINFQASPKSMPNIICIQMEAIDANIIRIRHKGESIAPFLSGLSKSELYFPFMLGYHLAGGTSDCEFSIVNGAEPFKNAVALKLRNYGYKNSFIKILNGIGYKTAAFHGNLKNFYNRGEAYPRMGYQAFFDLQEMGLSQDGWGAPDGALFNYVSEKSKQEKKPFFYYVITMSTHIPSNHQPAILLGEGYNDLQDIKTRNYFKTVHYLDSCLDEFVSSVRERLPNTYFLIYGDHTPDFNTKTHPNPTLQIGMEYLEFVPLIIIAPPGDTLSDKKTLVSFLDIAPSILAATGVKCMIQSKGSILGKGNLGDSPVFYQGLVMNRDSIYNILLKKFPKAD